MNLTKLPINFVLVIVPSPKQGREVFDNFKIDSGDIFGNSMTIIAVSSTAETLT